MSATQPIRVLLVDRDEQSRRAVRSILGNCSDVKLVAEVPDSSALTTLSEQNVDVALVGVCPPAVDGIDLTKQIRKLHPSVRVLIFTTNDSPNDIFAAMDAGADGYVLQKSLSKLLEFAISSVRLGSVWLDPGIARQVLEAMVSGPITADSRVLPTGFLPIPLMPDEKTLLSDVASSTCKDGVCMVDPSFVLKLKRFAS